MKELNNLENIYVVEHHEIMMFYTSDVGKDKVIVAKKVLSPLKAKLIDFYEPGYEILVPKKYVKLIEKQYDILPIRKEKYHYVYNEKSLLPNLNEMLKNRNVII